MSPVTSSASDQPESPPPSVNSSAALRHELSPNRFVSQTAESVPQTTNSIHYMPPNVSNGGPVAYPPFIYQTQPPYYPQTPQHISNYYPLSQNGLPMTPINSGKDIKIRQSVPGISSGKPGKLHNDIRTPFYTTPQFSEVCNVFIKYMAFVISKYVSIGSTTD